MAVLRGIRTSKTSQMQLKELCEKRLVMSLTHEKWHASSTGITNRRQISRLTKYTKKRSYQEQF